MKFRITSALLLVLAATVGTAAGATTQAAVQVMDNASGSANLGLIATGLVLVAIGSRRRK